MNINFINVVTMTFEVNNKNLKLKGYFKYHFSLSISIDSIHILKLSFRIKELCDPIDGSPPGSPVPGILQARTLEWVAISFSAAMKLKDVCFLEERL